MTIELARQEPIAGLKNHLRVLGRGASWLDQRSRSANLYRKRKATQQPTAALSQVTVRE